MRGQAYQFGVMSVGVTVHEVDLSPANPLVDLESARKNVNEKLRIRRLVEVRQQSKQLAAKVRQNYQQAKEKELAKIERTKREELKAWKRRHIRQLQDEYARNVCEVGEAHRAAEAAEECAVWFEEKRATQQAIALQRGKTAEANVARERERKEALKEAKARKKAYVPSKSIAVQATLPVIDSSVGEPLQARSTEPTDFSSSSGPTPSPYEQFCLSRKQKTTLPTVHETIASESEDELHCPGTAYQLDKENVPNPMEHLQDYNATAFTSPSDFRPIVVEPQRPLQPFTQITELIQQRRQRQQPQHNAPYDTRPPTATQRPISAGTYGVQKTVQFDDMSDNTLSFPTSSVLTNDDRPFTIAPAGSPRKVPPRKLVEKPRVSPVQQGVQSASIVTKRGKAVPPVESSTASVSYGGASTKVQYYDCNTKFRKEYDQPVGFVQREERRTDHPTGMEEANRYEELQQKLASARSISMVDRAKPALEKQQTRKDYEKLSQELDKLTRTENRLKGLAVPSKPVPTEAMLKQKAESRQRKASEAVERLLQQRALVTCPVVQAQPDVKRPNIRPSVVNVATATNTDRQDVSTDSCASIVLGTFDRPGIPLPSEEVPTGTGAGSVDKIAKLKELLEQINEQRRLLTDEIALEKTEESTKVAPDGDKVRVEIDRLERMKRRQEELIKQQELLKQREREVEELSRQLDEKMEKLQQKKAVKKTTKQQQQPVAVPPVVQVDTKAAKGMVDVDVIHPSSASSSSEQTTSRASYESNSERVADVPVKIIITVNDKTAGTPSRKKQRKKILQKKKSPVKVVEKSQQKRIETEPVPAGRTTLPKPLPTRQETMLSKATRKTAASKTIDFSPSSSSTTSTVYRTLPPKIGSLKTNQLLQEAPSKHPVTVAPPDAPKHSAVPKHVLQKTGSFGSGAKGANLNPHLLKYIVRLLGMSRQSIDQLGVSTTSVSTPSESVVNVSSNRSGAALAPDEQDIERTERLRKFIDENYNFLQEIDETLQRSDQSTLGGRSDRGEINDQSVVDESEVSRVEGVWMETLRRRERRMQQKQQKKKAVVQQNPNEQVAHVPAMASVAPPIPEPVAPPTVTPTAAPPPAPLVKEGSLKSILKSPKRDTSSKVAKIITPQGHVEVINLSDREEQEILDRYSQLTERCSQRISELSQMINQVREEKRRLIEDSMSSLEQQDSSTKYMDLPVALGAGVGPSGVRVEAGSQPEASALSPDPVPTPPAAQPTVAGEDPVSEEIDNIFSSKQIGLSKDSGIAMSRPLTASDIRESPSEEGSQGKEPLPFEPFLKDIPKPASEPQAVAAVGPSKGATRRNVPPVAIARFSPQLPDELPMHELSTIPEVETPAVASSKVNDLSATTVAGDAPSAAEQVLVGARNRLLLNESTPDIGYNQFLKYEEYVRAATTASGSVVGIELEKTVVPGEQSELRLDLTEDCEPGRLEYRKYPTPAPPFDITEDREATLQRTASKSSSVSSLPDVVNELKKLNIIMKPFDGSSLDNSHRSGNGDDAALQLSDMLGLRWASSMLKRNQQPRHSSGSSPSSLSDAKAGGRANGDDTLDDGAGSGKPPNLEDFIERELMVRTLSDVQSISSVSSSSHGSHSTLLRSLLNLSALHLNHSNAYSSPGRELLIHTPTDGKTVHRTSTPVASKSTTVSGGNSFRLPGDGANTDPITANRTETGLFSGESRLSSVHWSSSSGGNSSSERQEPPPPPLAKLTAPDVRLERLSANRDGK
uniref:Uncharacterized protein n=1 Tax=Anopheles farauti TaxID=69004 RepID=A0A182QP15_9DIPT